MKLFDNPLGEIATVQYSTEGKLQHLLTLADLPASVLEDILHTAHSFRQLGAQEIKKIPALAGKMVFNLFFENSTRTRTTFEIAAKCLSADVINLAIETSSTKKGETLLDTINTLSAMGADMFIVRHPTEGIPAQIAQYLQQQDQHIPVINAGDGCHAHPTQGLLDLYTIRHYKGDFKNLSVAIVGDVLHSRVARSDIHGLLTLGVQDIRLIGPAALLPAQQIHKYIHLETSLHQGLADADVIIMLRLQHERMAACEIQDTDEYFSSYGLTEKRLKYAKPDAIVMHPGPMNRGVEIDSAVADGAQSVILSQVRFGIAVRMAIMSMLA